MYAVCLSLYPVEHGEGLSLCDRQLVVSWFGHEVVQNLSLRQEDNSFLTLVILCNCCSCVRLCLRSGTLVEFKVK